jgi:hypothetical protein
MLFSVSSTIKRFFRGHRLRFPVGTQLALKEYLSPGDWNAGKGMAMPKNKALKQFNSYLEEVRQIT